MKLTVKELKTGRVYSDIESAYANRCHDYPYCTGCPLLKHYHDESGGCWTWTVLNQVEAARTMGYKVLHIDENGKDPVMHMPF